MSALAALLLSAGALTVQPLVSESVLEPSVLNEVEHAISRGEEARTHSVASASATDAERRAVATFLGDADASSAAIKLVSAQKGNGHWFLGATNVTLAVLEKLRDLAGLPQVVCSNGVCRIVQPSASASGGTSSVASAVASAYRTRLSQGYQSEESFLAFLRDAPQSNNPLIPQSNNHISLFVLLAIFIGGLALNLTPCVLPLVPVSVVIIGASWRRGLFYALGMALSYGVLGLFAALGGLAFGTIQSNPWFNGAVALVFAALALALTGVWHIDFSRHRFRAGAFVMGAVTAVLAGACVAPVLVSVLVLTADLYAQGRRLAALLPFVLGLGMALPWPFLAAGFKVFPKPGRWMVWVNRIFAVVIFALAARYAALALSGGTRSAFGCVGLSPSVRVASASVPAAAFPAVRDAWLARPDAKPLFVDIGASWCKNCRAMEATTLVAPAVQKALQTFEVVRLSADDFDALLAQPDFRDVKGLPAYLVFEK